jgi:hypothetical protein
VKQDGFQNTKVLIYIFLEHFTDILKVLNEFKESSENQKSVEAKGLSSYSSPSLKLL